MNGRSKVVKILQRQFLIKNTIKHLNQADINIGVSNLVLKHLRHYKNYDPRKEFVLYNFSVESENGIERHLIIKST